MKTHHFHTEDRRRACNARRFQARTSVALVTCQRCLSTKAYAKAVEAAQAEKTANPTPRTTHTFITDASTIEAILKAAIEYAETWMRGRLTITGVRSWEECLQEGPAQCATVSLAQTNDADEVYQFCMTMVRSGKLWIVYDDHLPMAAFPLTREELLARTW